MAKSLAHWDLFDVEDYLDNHQPEEDFDDEY